MKTRPALAALVLPIATLVSAAVAADESFSLRFSAGSSWQERNTVRIPNNDQGTRFSLEQLVGDGPVDATRFELNWLFNNPHGVRIMLAPLSYTESASLDSPIMFAGESFAANQDTDATYKFNSWRIGYHYTLRQNKRGFFRIGGTLKVRDAEVRLRQGAVESFDDDIGVVPLFYMAAQYKVDDRWTVGADFDGLAGGPGRAIDLGVTLDYAIADKWSIGADFRVLDGGADVDDVFNFARFYSAALAVSYRSSK